MSEQAAEPAPQRSWRPWLLRGAGVAFLLGLVLCLAWRPVFRAIPGWLCERQPPCAADAIVVLAGDSSGGRVDAALALFQSGHVASGPFVLSGGQLYGEISWASLMAKRAIAAGVPPERILSQERSLTTVEDAQITLELLEARGVKTLLLVTSASHSGRAARLFRRESQGRIEVVSCPAPDPPPEWWNDAMATRALATELLKRIWPGPGG